MHIECSGLLAAGSRHPVTNCLWRGSWFKHVTTQSWFSYAAESPTKGIYPCSSFEMVEFTVKNWSIFLHMFYFSSLLLKTISDQCWNSRWVCTKDQMQLFFLFVLFFCFFTFFFSKPAGGWNNNGTIWRGFLFNDTLLEQIRCRS